MIKKYLEDNLYRFEIENEVIYLDFEKENYVSMQIAYKFIKIQFNTQENYFYENIEQIFINFIKGNYIIKYYLNNDKVLYSKFIWKNKNLKKYNFKTKYGFHFCRKINNIEVVKGVEWNKPR